MTAIGLASAKGSPGVTTSAVLLAAVWHGAVLLEADPSGGDLRYWYPSTSGAPMRADLGVVSMLTTPMPWRRPDLTEHLQYLPEGLPVLVGPGAPAQVAALRDAWRYLADHLAARHPRNEFDDPDGTGTGDAALPHFVVDVGKLTGPESLGLSVPLLGACDLTLLVCRATVASLGHTRDLAQLLRELGLHTELLLLASGQARADAARAVGVPLDAVHVLPFAPDQAAGLAGAWTRRLDRSPLLAAGRALADQLHQRLTPPPVPTLTSPSTASSGESGGALIELRDEVPSS